MVAEKELPYGCWVMDSDCTVFDIRKYEQYKKQNRGCANCVHCEFCGDKRTDLWTCDCRVKSDDSEIFPIENGKRTEDYNFCNGEYYEPIPKSKRGVR